MSSEPTRRLEDKPGAATRRIRQVPPRFDWFADEIAIDFPSVGAVVDRMRDAFLAPEEQPRPLTTEILLSPLDAFTGTVVPLDLPVRGMCQACGGRGETWTEQPCVACHGSGEALFTHAVQVSVPPRIVDGAYIRLQVSTPHAPPTRVDVRVTIAQ